MLRYTANCCSGSVVSGVACIVFHTWMLLTSFVCVPVSVTRIYDILQQLFGGQLHSTNKKLLSHAASETDDLEMVDSR